MFRALAGEQAARRAFARAALRRPAPKSPRRMQAGFYRVDRGGGAARRGALSANETRALTASPPVTVGVYVGSGTFWYKTVSTWQAEFVAIGAFVVLSIFLRQEGSAESKPVGSRDEQTGETNK
jgi:hypothetical protein